MSMARCKCDKIFDTDEEIETDEKGNCCCDNCFSEIMEDLHRDLRFALAESFNVFGGVNVDKMVEILLNKNYRKVN